MIDNNNVPKILHWSFLFYPHLGGLSTHIDSLVNNLPEFKHEIITNRLPGTKKIERYSENTIINRFGPTAFSNFQQKWLRRRSSILYDASCEILRTFKQKRYFNNSNYDILHVHETTESLISLDIALKTNVFSKLSHIIFNTNKIKRPKLLTKHFLTIKNVHHPKVIEWDYKFISDYNNIICVDRQIFENISKYFESYNMQRNLWYIPNTIDLNKFRYIPPENKDKLKVGIVGRLSPDTGEYFLIDLLKKIRDFMEIYWACSGNNQRINNLIRSIKNENIHIYPNVKYEDLPKFYCNINVLFNPIEFEYNVSRVTLESMACGRPVIMFPGSRYPLINEKNGFIIKHDINDVLSLLCELNLDRNKLRKMGEESRYIIEKEFATEVIIPKVRKVYNMIQE